MISVRTIGRELFEACRESAGEGRPERHASISPPKIQTSERGGANQSVQMLIARCMHSRCVRACGWHSACASGQCKLTQAARRKSERPNIQHQGKKNRSATHLVDMLDRCGEMSCVARNTVHVRNTYLVTRTSQPFDVRVFACCVGQLSSCPASPASSRCFLSLW